MFLFFCFVVFGCCGEKFSVEKRKEKVRNEVKDAKKKKMQPGDFIETEYVTWLPPPKK